MSKTARIWRGVLFLPFFLLLLSVPATAQAAKDISLFSIDLTPRLLIPVGDSSAVFGLGGGSQIGMRYRLPLFPLAYLSGGISYDFVTANEISLTVSVASATLGAGLQLDPLSWLSVSIGVAGGYFYSFLNDFSVSAGNPFMSADAGVRFLPAPWHVSLGASWLWYLGLSNNICASIGLSYDLAPSSAGAQTQVQQKPAEKAAPLVDQAPRAKIPAGPLDLQQPRFDDIYPVFHAYYDTHPLGSVVLKNVSDKPMSGIRVSFQIKEFMADPKDCPAPAELAPGQSKSVDLFALFLPAILQTTEKTKTQVRIDVSYTIGGQARTQCLVQSVSILDRNATTWADDRRAASFVTTKDPAVLTFSKNVSSMVKGKVPGAVNPSLLTAMAIFQTLQLYGLTYSMDPIPVITDNKQVADYIQFPRQTLQYKGGKCSDFSVLYCALLESVGIETAFITIPGHIFIAFSAGVSAEEARRSFSRADDLIIRNETVWIPVEVTESAGFLKAWQDGAKEWRENLSRGQAELYPLHDAWQVYAPVGLPGAEVTVILPSSDKVIASHKEEAGRFIDQEILPRAAALQGEIQKARDSRKPTNALGVLYARYGQYDRAQRQFEKLLAKEDYVPALLNLGTILGLNGQKEKALDYFNRAYAKDPKNPHVLLAVARCSHELEDYFRVKKVYAELQQADPDLAQQYAFLGLKGEEATRAADAAGATGVVLWEE